MRSNAMLTSLYRAGIGLRNQKALAKLILCHARPEMASLDMRLMGRDYALIPSHV